MRLRLFDRLWRLTGWRPGSRDAGRDKKRESRAGGHRKRAGFPPRAPTARPVGLPSQSPGQAPADGVWLGNAPADPGNSGTAAHPAHAGAGSAGVGTGGGGAGAGAGQARIREAPFGSAPVESLALAHEAPAHQAARGVPAQDMPARHASRPAVPREPWYQVVPPLTRQSPGQGRPQTASGIRVADPGPPPRPHEASSSPRSADLPFAAAHPAGVHCADGRTNCGPIERILWRQWDEGKTPPPQAVAAVERLASFPKALQEKLANGLDGIYIGSGGVPELDHMTELRGVPLPSGRATWDACAGAYGERKIVVGTRPSPTPDVMCHEVGHALDDLDSPPGKWQSDSSAFRLIYDECQPHIASDFHRQRGGLGRKEFFADAFAAIASGQRPALVDMLNGNTRSALKVMLYFNRRYGI